MRYKVHNLIKALRIVQPDVLITINHIADNRPEAVRRMTKMRRHWTENSGLTFHNGYVLEHHVTGDLHVHMLGHQDHPNENQILTAALKAGVDVSDAKAVHTQRLGPCGGLTYLFKETETDSGLRRYREANGSRLFNASRGFWRAPGHAPVRGGHEALRRSFGGSR